MKILIVDDQEENRYLLEALLKGSGHETEIAVNGKEALTLFKSDVFQMVISDILMPVMDGYQLCHEIRNVLENRSVIFVFYTATYVEEEDEKLAFQMGADAFIRKPLDPPKFMSIINPLIEKAESRPKTPEKISETDENDVFKLYNQRLIHKLEQKMLSLEREVKERIEAENALKESEEKYRNLIEQSNDAIYLLYRDKFELINSKFSDLFGYSLEDCQADNFNFRKLVSPQSIDTIEGRVEKRAKGEPIEAVYKFTAIRKDGKSVECEVNTSEIDYKGSKAVQGIIRDISQRVRMEREKKQLQEQLIQAQKMEAIGTLAGGIAHDFNNMLGVIMGYTEIALNDLGKNHDAEKSLSIVMKASKRVKEMVQQILTFSRKNEPHMIPIEIGTIIQETVQFLRSSIPTTIEIKSDIQTGNGSILGNETQINQILMNLCSNAAHVMKSSGGTISIALKQISITAYDAETDLKPGTYQKLSVSDTGAGMSEETLKRVFEPFFTTKNAEEGTGLGLSVVYGIVKNHNGQIIVKSILSKGTDFFIYFPVLKSEQTIHDAIPRRKTLKGNFERILFIDDETFLTDLGKIILRELNYQVTCRNSSVDALSLFKKDPQAFDLVITDMTMPNMDGIKLTQEIKQIRPDLPVILCTGYSAIINQSNYHKYDISALVMKPVIKSEIAEAIRKSLKTN